MELFKLLNFKLILAQMVCFFIVLAVLKRFLWKPVFNILEARQQKIDEQMKALESVKAEAVRMRAEIEQALANIEHTAQKRLKEVEQAGEQKTREMKEKARVEAEQIINDARTELRYELLRARDTFKGDIVDMVIKATEQMMQEKLTSDNDRKLVETLLGELEKSNAR